MLRLLRYLVEAIAAFVGVGIVLGLLLAWRLSVSPISSDFLTPYIETGIESVVPGSTAHLDATLLTWSRAERAIQVHVENIQVSDANGGEIAHIPMLDAKISVLGLLVGQFLPKELAIDHPQIKLEHKSDGAFVFGGKAMRGGQTTSPVDTMDVVARNMVQQLSHTLLMHSLSVTRAVFDIHDDATQKDWSFSIPEITLTRSILSEVDRKLEYGAMDGHATIEVTQKDAIASVDVRYGYDPQKEQHSLSAIFNDVTPAFFAGGHPETLGIGVASLVDLPLTGKIKVTLDKQFVLQTVAAQIHGDEGHLVDRDFWDEPCPITSFDFNADYDRAAKKLTVSNTHADFGGGAVLDLKIDGVPSAQKNQDLDFTAVLTVNNVPMNRYGALVPKPILPDPRYWLTANLRDGLYTHAEATLKGALAWNDLANLSVTEGGGKLSAIKGTVTYVDGLPPVENVNADAVFDLKKMDVKITTGNIGNIRLAPFTVSITGLADPDQNIDIPLQVSGPVPEIMQLLDHQPLGYAKALGLSPEDIGGKIEGSVHFRFPLLKTLEMKNVDLHATANATAVASTKLIPNLAIDQGNFALTLDIAGFGLNGQAALNKVPFRITWQENFENKKGQNRRHATVLGSIREDQWSNFGITVFNGTKGSMNVSLDMTKPNKEKMLMSGLLDMTPAAVSFDMLNWKKPANLPATLKFATVTSEGKPITVSSLSLRGTQIQADGDATLSPDMNFLSLNLSSLVLGRTNAALQFVQTFGEKGALRFDATGTSLDVSGLRGGKDPDRADPRPKEYHIQVDKLYTGSVGEIDKATGSATRDQQGWSAINLHGLADGTAPLSIELTAQPDGHRNFAISSSDFGKAMKGLGCTDTITGGKLYVGGQSSVENPRLVEGTIKISDFTVEKLPVLALLINATSPFGFTDILTDSADFSRFQGAFHWQGDMLTLTHANASGSAIGINVDGKVDMNTGDSNLEGTLVPFSTVNKIIGFIPLIGDLITGGEDQGVLAVAYTIKGALSDPSIWVNPISLLTPGFLRNLFFPDDAAEDKK